MKQLNELQTLKLKAVFTDIDGTLTTQGRIGISAYSALWKLHSAGVLVIPVTGRPAGWCEMIARTWPVHGVIGENGAFYYRYHQNKMHRHYSIEDKERLKFQQRLLDIQNEILKTVPGTAIASDQFCRQFDLAIDFCEDVSPLSKTEVDQIVQIFKTHGAIAKVSNIHVNGWFGDYDKISACKDYCINELGKSFDQLNSEIAFIGDSPNDEPMFEAFIHSFAVSNISEFIDQLTHLPAYTSSLAEGEGFSEIVDALIS